MIQGEKLWTTTPNLVFGKHYNVGLTGFCLGDKELIDWGLNDPGAHGPRKGGFYQVLEAMIEDRHFWAEAPIYALHYDVHGMLALAEAARHYDGTDLYHYVSKKSGASIKGVVDGYILMSYPLERTGIGRGSIRLATFADGSTSYTPRGELFDTFLVNPLDAAPNFSGELEIAYKRYKDPGYAWLLGLNPKRDANITYGRATWGYIALTHGVPLPERTVPPPAPGGVYPGLGFALLRADQSPNYWTSGGLTAVVMLGKWLSHGHADDYNLILHGKGRLLYPDLNVIQYEPSYLNWTREGIAHNTLLVDHQSPAHGPFTTRQDLGPDVKYFSITGSAYQDVRQTRAVFLTKEYLADFFQAADTQEAKGTVPVSSDETRDSPPAHSQKGTGPVSPDETRDSRPAQPRVRLGAARAGSAVPRQPGRVSPQQCPGAVLLVDRQRAPRTTDATFQADWIHARRALRPACSHWARSGSSRRWACE